MVKISLGKSVLDYSYLTLILYSCIENADPEIICSPLDEIDEYLGMILLSLIEITETYNYSEGKLNTL